MENMDRHTTEQRSRNMAAVRGRNTKPELRVRSSIHRQGFRYSLHRKDLPGKPDLVFPQYQTVVLVHGCFWHGHSCKKGKRPASNKRFWNKKLDYNLERDRKNVIALGKMGWRVFIIWECELEKGIDRAVDYLKSRRQKRAKNPKNSN